MALRHNTVKIPGTNQLAGRDTVLHAPDVVMLVINNRQQMVLEKQWRDSVNQFTYEIPAGKIDSRDHHNPRHAALRELNEEVRVKPGKLIPMFENCFYNSPGCTNEASYFYLATNLIPVQQKLPRDQGEFMRLQWFTKPQIIDLIQKGQLKDLQSMVAILDWLNHK